MELQWLLRAGATTTNLHADATTSGPFKIPNHAPDIAAFFQSTTVVSAGYDVIIATTSGAALYDAPYKTWAKSISANKRCFSIAIGGKSFDVGVPIKIRYRAVGELVRP